MIETRVVSWGRCLLNDSGMHNSRIQAYAVVLLKGFVCLSFEWLLHVGECKYSLPRILWMRIEKPFIEEEQSL